MIPPAMAVALSRLWNAQDPMQAAEARLARADTVFMHLVGSETIAGVRSRFAYDVYFQREANRLRIGLACERDGRRTLTVVGDGERLWRYRDAANVYEVWRYGKPDRPPTAAYRPTFFRLLSGLADAVDAYPLALLRQVYGSTAPRFEPWFEGPPPAFAKNAEVRTSAAQARRLQTDFAKGELVSASFESAGTHRGVERRLAWRLQLFPGFRFADSNFRFAPPPGARAISRRP